MKITTIIGARPQFIKAAVVSRALQETEGIEETLVHTGQHYDRNMSGIFFSELEMPEVDCFLGVGSGTHGKQTGLMMAEIERLLMDDRPAMVMVYGDTNTTLAGALTAAKLHIPVAHVEAGLRSFNRLMPEEINRVLTDHVSEILFTPTETAVKNLENEGIYGEKVHLSGDVMYDASLFYGEKAESHSVILKELGLEPKGYILATVHRAENTDIPERLGAIFNGLARTAQKHKVVVPVHPRTRKLLEGSFPCGKNGSLMLIDPVGYLDMVMLEKNSLLVATDSGGVQKEAYFYGVPCVTLRDETEWVELVESGWNRVLKPENPETVERGILSAIGSSGRDVNLYGDGRASGKIAGVIHRKLQEMLP